MPRCGGDGSARHRPLAIQVHGKNDATVIPEGGLAIARYGIGFTAAPAEKLNGDKESGQCQARGAVVLRFGKREPVGGV